MNSILFHSLTTLGLAICLTVAVRAQESAYMADSSSTNLESTTVGERFDFFTPVTVFKPKIEFPLELLSHATEAKVFVKVLVDSTGDVRSVKILKSTDSLFDKYAISYARKYKFAWKDTASQNFMRQYKKVWLTIPFHFTK